MKNNTNLFTSLLKILNVPFTFNYANSIYRELFVRRTILELSQLLTIYNIYNKTIKFSSTNQIDENFNIIVPFVTSYNGDIVIVHQIKDEKLIYITETSDGSKAQYIHTNSKDFLLGWSMVALVIEPSSNSIEPYYKEHKSKERSNYVFRGISVLALFLCSTSFFIYNLLYQSWGIIILLILNVIGVYISYLLLLKQFHIQNSNADKICFSLKNGDCDSVLNTSASKIMGIFSWSEIGLSYFISNIMILLTFPSLLNYLIIINICALPYTIWSIWYQKFKIKQWCPLCLIVQFLLWFISILNSVWTTIDMPTFAFSELIPIGVVFTFTFLSIHLYVCYLDENGLRTYMEIQLTNLKSEDSVFLTVLKRQLHFDINKNISKVLFGNINADIIITILTNPYCKGCSLMHKRVNKLLNQFGEEICIQYLFPSSKPLVGRANKALIEIYLKNTTNNTWKIYDDWFDGGKYDEDDFFKTNQVTESNELAEEEFYKHQIWAKDNKIDFTPVVLINGYRLPVCYSIEDIGLLLNSTNQTLAI